MRLTLRDVSIGFDANAPLQKNVKIEVASGEVCCILGPNGCGKSTLVKAIITGETLLSGSITVDGDDVTKWSAARIGEIMAYVEQRHERTFNYTVREVVMLGRTAKLQGLFATPTADDMNIVDNALYEMGIYDLRNESYMDISGGELQMVMFAMAIAQEPELLILDEPTAALDYGNAVRVIEKVRKLARMGYAVIMITHNPDHAFMTGANVALLMRAAPMRFGTAEQIITQENIKRAYGINVRLVAFTHKNGTPMRTCAPEFEED